MGRKRWWGVAACLAMFVMLGGVAEAANLEAESDASATIGGSIDSTGKDITYTATDVVVSTYESQSALTIEGTGKVTFSGTLSTTKPGEIDEVNGNYGIYIAGGEENTFNGKVTAGYLTSGENSSVNVFKADVELWDKDRDPGEDGQPLTGPEGGYALGLGDGTYTFEQSVKFKNGDTPTNMNAAFAATASGTSTTTFSGTGTLLDVGTGKITIGYGSDVERTPAERQRSLSMEQARRSPHPVLMYMRTAPCCLTAPQR